MSIFDLIFAEDLNIKFKEKIGIKPRKNIQLVWGAGWPNFGDALSPLIVNILSKYGIFGKNADNSPAFFSKRLIALGSSLWKARNGDFIWGSGLKGYTDFSNRKNIKIYAVRGPLTREILIKQDIFCPVIYGDPAILMPYIYKPNKKVKKYKIGIIPHFNDLTPYKNLCSKVEGGVKLIDIRHHPLKVINEICNCEIVLSSSLHGIILSEAYGIKACWLYPDKSLWKSNIPQKKFKYYDYYLATEREMEAYEFNFDSFNLVDILKKIELQNNIPTFNEEKLLLSFPFLKNDILKIEDLKKYEIRTMQIVPTKNIYKAKYHMFDYMRFARNFFIKKRRR